MTPIESHETWNVQDSTKLQCFMDCPRQYFFEYVLGWRREEKSIHLEHGIAVHKAMECIYPVGGPDFSDSALTAAMDAYFAHYRTVYTADQDEENSPKNPECTFRALAQYREHYAPIDNFEVLHNEVAGSVLLNEEGDKLYFKQDTICRNKEGRVFSLEHKTGTSFRYIWALDWCQSIQVGTYAHVLHCLYDDVYGVEINGIFIHEPPKFKKDGTPYANAKDNEFHRVPVAKAYPQMQDWITTVLFWYDVLKQQFEKLQYVKEDDLVMDAFPKNPRACTKYFGCAFADVCAAYINPLRCETIPVGFCVSHWDPREKFSEAKKVVEL